MMMYTMLQGVKEAVMVQCYNDCPEEVYWVLEQAKVRDSRPFLLILKRQGHEIRIGLKWDGLIGLG
jgi:hypothetical protein